MARLVVFSIVLAAAITLAICEVSSNILVYTDGQDIPKRCIDNTVTPVSCEHVVTNDSLIAHPDDCELFYYCLTPDHAPICRQCPAHLHFNPKEHLCDYPGDAGCK